MQGYRKVQSTVSPIIHMIYDYHLTSSGMHWVVQILCPHPVVVWRSYFEHGGIVMPNNLILNHWIVCKRRGWMHMPKDRQTLDERWENGLQCNGYMPRCMPRWGWKSKTPMESQMILLWPGQRAQQLLFNSNFWHLLQWATKSFACFFVLTRSLNTDSKKNQKSPKIL